MNIVVCLKQVPTEAGFDRTTNTVIREERGQMTNPSDIWALEMALAVKDRLGARVTALTMGKPFAAAGLKAAATLGADRLFLVSDPELAGSDTYATAAVLAAAIRSIGGADLVLCGRRAVDGETGQVGPELAVMLGLPCLTNIAGLESITAAHLVCRRLLEDRDEIFRAAFPCLLTACDGVTGIPHPRVPGLADFRRARDIPVQGLTRRDLPDLEAFGPQGSPTRVHKTFIPEESGRQGFILTEAEAGAAEIAKMIRQALAPQTA